MLIFVNFLPNFSPIFDPKWSKNGPYVFPIEYPTQKCCKNCKKSQEKPIFAEKWSFLQIFANFWPKNGPKWPKNVNFSYILHWGVLWGVPKWPPIFYHQKWPKIYRFLSFNFFFEKPRCSSSMGIFASSKMGLNMFFEDARRRKTLGSRAET